MAEKVKIEKNTVQETLVLPLYARKICMDRFPDLFADPACQQLIDRIDYDFEGSGKNLPLFGALEGGVRHYDLCCEVKEYLQKHPKACVINLGCGLDTTFTSVDNGKATGWNLDMPDVIAVRNQLLPPQEREHNIPCDLNDTAWFEQIDFRPEDGAVMIAGGVFYYFRTEQVQALFCKMAEHFPGGRIAFDATTPMGLKIVLKTWLKDTGAKDFGVFFHVKNAEKELLPWSKQFASVRHKKYMTGYRAPDKRWGAGARMLSHISDAAGLTQIIQVEFAGRR